MRIGEKTKTVKHKDKPAQPKRVKTETPERVNLPTEEPIPVPNWPAPVPVEVPQYAD